MPATDSRVDDYISKSADFAKPILTYLRNVVHHACPEVRETIKWSFPNFEYAGTILCNMASFKQHCSFGFWLGSQLSDPEHLFEPIGEKTSMGHLGQLRSMADVPSEEVLTRYIKEAMTLNEKGIKVKKERSATPKETVVPEYFLE